MYSIHNLDDSEKFKKLQETKSLLKAEKLKEKLEKQYFHYDVEEVFEPVTAKQVETTEIQKQLSGKQIQILRDSSQTTRQAIKNQTRTRQESSDILHTNLQKSNKQGIQEYDKITNRYNQLLRVLLTPTKLIIVLSRQFPTFLMTKIKVNLV